MYTVDNTSEDETDFNLIRSRINMVISSRKEFIIKYPINYLLFCLDLQNVQDSILLLQDFKRRAKKFGIEGETEVSKLLYFLCDRIGIIQHFDKEGVDHIIVNQPQFLYNEVSNLIIETFKGKTLNAEEQMELEKGILSFSAAESIIGSENKLITTRELLDLLVHLRIVARFKDKFFIPCVINHLPEVSDEDLQPEESSVAPLYVCFGRGYCPKGLFGVLVTYLLSPEETAPAKLRLEFEEDKVSKDQVFFQVESGEDFLDLLWLKVISCSFLEVGLIPEERDSAQIAEVCMSIRTLIETFLSKSFQDLHYNKEIAKYEICLKCEICSEHHKVLSTNNLRCKRKRVSLPAKGRFWFSEFEATGKEDEKISSQNFNLHSDHLQKPKQSGQPPLSPVSSAGLMEFNEDMSPEELCTYLSSNKMPQKDCTLIKECDIGGAVFLDFVDDDWKEFGVSKVGLVYIKRIKEKMKSYFPAKPLSLMDPSCTTLLQSFGLSEELANQKVSDIHVVEISRCHCKDWKLLCPYLELERIVVSDLEHKSGGEGERRRSFLSMWRERKGSEATYGRLLYALLKTGCREDAEGVCKLMKSTL